MALLLILPTLWLQRTDKRLYLAIRAVHTEFVIR